MIAHYFPNGLERYVIGGIFVGLGVSLLYLTTGRQGGASTFFSAAWSWFLRAPFFQQAFLIGTRQWRLVYAAGLILGGTLYALFGLPLESGQLPLWKYVVGGLLIGFGARLGGGCTSGHGICGMASLSPGSLLMVCAFLGTAIITALSLAALGV